MLESISDTFLNTTNKEFRVLIAIENKMKFYEWVPIEEIASFTNYELKEVSYILSNLAVNKLIHRNIQAYEGYRIYFEAYDLLALNAFVKRGSVNALGDEIGVGKKESVVYEAKGGIIDRKVIIKFHREGKMSFKKVRIKREHIGERKHLSWLYASRLAAKREYDALKTLYPEVSVPEPVDYNRHAIVMSIAKGQELAHTKIDEPDWYLDEILEQVRKAYRLGIIHGDLSEFNIFVNPEGCVLSFFNRKYRIKRDIREVINTIVT
ncbi:MAG: serine/threonine protein kinase [Candidatus Methanoperedens sp.]|nr:serine/threonine protein kinase [Candidatus Methanoperedens sp.]